MEICHVSCSTVCGNKKCLLVSRSSLNNCFNKMNKNVPNFLLTGYNFMAELNLNFN